MADPNQPEPVIVPLGQVVKAFTRGESALQSQATAAASEEDALALAAIGLTIKKIQNSPPEELNSNLMVTKQNAAVSRLQSLIATGEAGDLELFPAPAGGLEAKFDTKDWAGWATVAWAKIRAGRKEDLIVASTTPEILPDKARVALLGDWGTGLYGAPVIANTIGHDPNSYDMLLHLGDVYYSGTVDEVRTRFLNLWPRRAGAINRALNSNHEMYSGGHAYFRETLPAFNQKASYFAHRNEHWILVGLDVAHKDHDIDDAQVDWLRQIVAGAGGRRIILTSHHQMISHFESMGTKLWNHQGFRQILQSGKIFAWYFAHIHKCCIYEEKQAETGIWMRCVGHGAMPEFRNKDIWDLPFIQGAGKNGAVWRRAAATVRSGISVPPALILDGRNPYIKGEEDKFLPHGYAVLNFDGRSLVEQVFDPAGLILFERELAG